MSDKSLKTFNLRRSTIKIVRTKQNQSEFVDRAIVRLHNQLDEIDADTYSLKQLLVWVSYKLPFDDPIRPLIIDKILKL